MVPTYSSPPRKCGVSCAHACGARSLLLLPASARARGRLRRAAAWRRVSAPSAVSGVPSVVAAASPSSAGRRRPPPALTTRRPPADPRSRRRPWPPRERSCPRPPLVRKDVALVDPDLHADAPECRARLCEPVVDVGAQRCKRHPTFAVPLLAAHLGAAESPLHCTRTPSAPAFNRRSARTLHRAAERDPTVSWSATPCASSMASISGCLISWM